MTQLMMMRINYDDRSRLQPYEKYGAIATQAEHDRIVNRYERRVPHIGGWGFHECLNFARDNDGQVLLHLPRSYMPGKNRIGDDFVIFSFTYSSDPVLPNHIVGVQAGIAISKKGVVNPASGGNGNIALSFNGVGPENMSTLFVPPLEWRRDEGRFLPPDIDWRMGRNYFNGALYPAAILDAARESATLAMANASSNEKKFLKRQIEVIDRIDGRYIMAPDGDVADDIAEIRSDLEITETDRKTLIDARLGQGRFRDHLDKRWSGACAVTGCDVREALRASHMKAWKDSSNMERLDRCNGLLLVANMDALFDRHLISFRDNGEMLVGALSVDQKKVLGLPAPLRKQLAPKELEYLRFHRQRFELKQQRAPT